MKPHLFLFMLMGIVLFSITGCGKNEESLCGPKRHWTQLVENWYWDDDLDFLTDTRTVKYEYPLFPDSICTEEHTDASFAVSPHAFPALPADFKVYGYIYWGGLWGLSTLLTRDPVDGVYRGTIPDVGLKQAYGDGPGSVGLQIKLVFPTHGTITDDTLYVQSLINQMAIAYDYYEDIP